MNIDKAATIQLSRLPKGKKAIIHEHKQSEFQLMLMEMGCIPGEAVLVEMIAPLGDPMAIKIAGYYLSIRKADADKIMVRFAS